MDKILMFLLLFLFYACGEQGQNKLSSSSKMPNNVIKNTPVILNSSVSDTVENFGIFWKDFRKAVIKSDTTQIKGLSFFPVEYRGPFDEDQIIKVSKDKFVIVFSLFLKQWHGDLEGSTELDYIKKTSVPAQRIDNKEIRIGNLVFRLKKGKWKLCFLYLNEETIEFLNEH